MPRARPHGLIQLMRKEINDAFEIFDTDNSGSGYWTTQSSLIQLVIPGLFFLVMQFDSWICSILRGPILYIWHTPTHFFHQTSHAIYNACMYVHTALRALSTTLTDQFSCME
jgi:hypothetical protein